MPSITQDNAKSAPLAYTVKGAAHAIGLSRSKLYMMMKAGTLRSVKVAGCRRIPAEALHDLLKPSVSLCGV
jgi:excisionase family DNA binding protein